MQLNEKSQTKSFLALTNTEGVSITPNELALNIMIKDQIFGEIEFTITYETATILVALLTIILDRHEAEKEEKIIQEEGW